MTTQKVNTIKMERRQVLQAYTRLFSTDDGSIVLSDLMGAFDKEDLHKNAHGVVISAAQRGVTDYIQKCIVFGGGDS